MRSLLWGVHVPVWQRWCYTLYRSACYFCGAARLATYILATTEIWRCGTSIDVSVIKFKPCTGEHICAGAGGSFLNYS